VRRVAWLGVCGLVVLTARSLAYALSSPLARTFDHRAGGPGLPIVIAAAVAIGFLLAVTVVWLAALGVRERALLEGVGAPRLRVRRLAVRAVALSAGSAVAFPSLESYLHWRAGLGWHGLHCLTGPAHRNALPILAALSLIAAAVAAAVEHVVAWMRRTLAALAARASALPRLAVLALLDGAPCVVAAASPGARGPPARVS
jgi:hypothetical protein